MAPLQPVYQDFSVNIDPKEHQKHHGKFALFRWHLPQNTAGLNEGDLFKGGDLINEGDLFKGGN